MARTMIDLDEEALAAAAKVLGTTTKKDTVNAALREAVARLRRYQAIREMQDMAARGDIDVNAFWEAHEADKAAAGKAAARSVERESPKPVKSGRSKPGTSKRRAA